MGNQRDLVTFRIGLVQTVALCVQLTHLRFRLGSDVLQLRQGANIPAHQKFVLFNSLVELTNLLPHGRGWMPRFTGEDPEHIQFPIIKNAQAFELARFLVGPVQPGMMDVWFSRVGFLRVEDALFDGLRGILLSQGFETNRARFSGRLQRRIFPIETEGVSFLT